MSLANAIERHRQALLGQLDAERFPWAVVTVEEDVHGPVLKWVDATDTEEKAAELRDELDADPQKVFHGPLMVVHLRPQHTPGATA